MSRAMNVSLTQHEVVRICADMGISTTSTEALIPSGTRVVCRTSEGSLALWNEMRAHIIHGAVRRMPRALKKAP